MKVSVPLRGLCFLIVDMNTASDFITFLFPSPYGDYDF